jgi:hypothetical protein
MKNYFKHLITIILLKEIQFNETIKTFPSFWTEGHENKLLAKVINTVFPKRVTEIVEKQTIHWKVGVFSKGEVDRYSSTDLQSSHTWQLVRLATRTLKI